MSNQNNSNSLKWLSTIVGILLSTLFVIALAGPAFAKTRVAQSYELFCRPGGKTVKKNLPLNIENGGSLFLSRKCKHSGKIELKNQTGTDLEVQIGVNSENTLKVNGNSSALYSYKSHYGGGFLFTVWTLN